jgi:hypothetical protein
MTVDTGGGGRRVAVLLRLVVWCKLGLDGKEGGRWREETDMGERRKLGKEICWLFGGYWSYFRTSVRRLSSALGLTLTPIRQV